MNRFTQLVCFVALLSTTAAYAQSPEAQGDEDSLATTSAPVAHVYVGNGTQVLAFSAAANGKLTPVPGSPFKQNLSWMGANGRYLFGFVGGGTTIASFSMASNGALKKVATYDTAGVDAGGCDPYSTGFRVDHSGQNLYSIAITTGFPCWTPASSFKINGSTGKLTFLSNTGEDRTGTFWASYPGFSAEEGTNLSILGNNQYAYLPINFYFSEPPSPSSEDSSGGWVCEFIPFERLSNGELVDSNATITIPAPPNDNADPNQPSPGAFCPASGASDPTNHLALLLQPIDANLGTEYGSAVIAPFTADANGNLKTTSTLHNMPVAETGGGSWLRMSPSGKLLALGGAGLELFHFNGAGPITKYKMLLPQDGIRFIFWDNSNHLYAIGTNPKGAGELRVFTATPTSVTEAPGSPYSIPNAATMAVQPL